LKEGVPPPRIKPNVLGFPAIYWPFCFIPHAMIDIMKIAWSRYART